MKLISLLEDVKIIQSTVSLCMDVKYITDDINKVNDESLFFCIKGTCFDGHKNATEALTRGAVAVVTMIDLKIERQIVVKDTKSVYNKAIEIFFGNPSLSFNMVGVTGTNGKTSVVTIAESIFLNANISIGIIGTMYSKYGNVKITSKLTTPDCYTLNSILHQMKTARCEVVCMEVSSHSLDQHRMGNIWFNTAVFTNLTQDHLDYHKDMESYYLCKRKLFDICDMAIINTDDRYGKRLCNELRDDKKNILTYSIQDKTADYYASDIVYYSDKVEFTLHHKNVSVRILFNMPGMFSVYNALASIAIAHHNGIRLGLISRVLPRFNGVAGRTEVIFNNGDFCVMRDYAHTPDGLYNILNSVKDYCKGDIILVFGCGGDRDKSKRSLMAKVASKYADKVIVTSDNPRKEEPQKIIDEIVSGFDKGYFYNVELDRKKAIELAMSIAKKGDTIVLAGKGHETYQIVGDSYYDFDEQEIVKATSITKGNI